MPVSEYLGDDCEEFDYYKAYHDLKVENKRLKDKVRNWAKRLHANSMDEDTVRVIIEMCEACEDDGGGERNEWKG